MPTRADLEVREAAALAPWAMRSRDSRGRRHPEPEHPLRMAFQRDRDRIIHSTAFRRLEYKTQVFVNHEGDYYRTRLTHTIEAAQVTRTLDRLMKVHGGFDHNSQSLRIVDVLEERYPAFRGLNLSWEVREGIVKHSTRYDRPQVREFDPELAPCLEAQIVDFADEIAYNAHDIDDGLKSGMLDRDELAGVPLWAEAVADAARRAPSASPQVLRYQGVRLLIDRLVTDLCESVLGRLRDLGV